MFPKPFNPHDVPVISEASGLQYELADL